MKHEHPRTVGDLIAAQPGYPVEHLLGRVVCSLDDAQSPGRPAHRPAGGVVRHRCANRLPARDRRGRPRVVRMTTSFTVLADLPWPASPKAWGAGQRAVS
jgi:hypothetical protein